MAGPGLPSSPALRPVVTSTGYLGGRGYATTLKQVWAQIHSISNIASAHGVLQCMCACKNMCAAMQVCSVSLLTASALLWPLLCLLPAYWCVPVRWQPGCHGMGMPAPGGDARQRSWVRLPIH
jgi:hypothetical protein